VTNAAGGLRFARATALYAVATFIPRVGLFLLLPIYARVMSQADVGAFSLAMSLAGALAILYRLGLDATLLRFHFDHERQLGRLYATTLALALGSIAILSSGAVAALVPLLPTLFGGTSVPVLAAVGIGAGNSLQFVPSAWFRATEQAGRYLALTAAVFAIAAIVTVWLVLGLRWGITGALAGQLAGAVAIALSAVWIVLRLPRPQLDRDLAARALQFGLPLVPHALAAWVLNASDRWILAWRLPLSATEAQAQIGIYWVGYQLGYAVALLAVSVQAAWLPIVYRQSDRAAGGRLVGAMLLIAAGVLSSAAVGLAAIGPELIALMAGDGYVDAVPILGIVAAASVLYGLYAMVVPVLLYERRTSTMAVVTLGSGLLNVLLNVALIPALGIVGSAVATLVANAAYLGITLAFARRRWPVTVPWVRTGLLVGLSTVLLLGAALLEASVPLGARLVVAVAFIATTAWAIRPALPQVVSA
jgi:O-antigen/teichoic acid export membrane protein